MIVSAPYLIEPRGRKLLVEPLRYYPVHKPRGPGSAYVGKRVSLPSPYRAGLA